MAQMLEYWYFKVAIINMFKEVKIKMIINDRWEISAEKQELQKRTTEILDMKTTIFEIKKFAGCTKLHEVNFL